MSRKQNLSISYFSIRFLRLQCSETAMTFFSTNGNDESKKSRRFLSWRLTQTCAQKVSSKKQIGRPQGQSSKSDEANRNDNSGLIFQA